MCGIVGYVGDEAAAPLVIDGLAHLEYRGYDSAGIAVLDGDRVVVTKDVGKLANLRRALGEDLPAGTTAIGHTRWATHGKATQTNAHPHTDMTGDIAVVHNGIVENYAALKAELTLRGHVFLSETDTEIIPHLIAEGIDAGLDLEEATRAAMNRIEGAAAVLTMRGQEPGVLVAARVGSAGGIVVGYGEDAMHVASDLPALLDHAERFVFLEDGELARVTAASVAYSDFTGRPLAKEAHSVALGAFVSDKGSFEHYMAKEIAEQPRAVRETLLNALTPDRSGLQIDSLNLSRAEITAIRRVVLVGMGTSYHSALIGRTYIEQLAGLPAEADNASEYRYRQPVIDRDTLVVAIGQSGETADTLAAMHEARDRGAKVIAVCNTPGSQATRLAHGTVYMHCGPEVAVASTKTFLGSLAALYLLACHLGRERGHIDNARLRCLTNDLDRVHDAIGGALLTQARTIDAAGICRDAHNMLFIGRGLQYPVAMEGALKLKEVSYVHAEGYAAGELKHGPIALIDERTPVVALAPRDTHYQKLLSNIEEIRARDGLVIAVATAGDEQIGGLAQHVIHVPDAPPLLQPLLTAVPLQILAYQVGQLRACDIDQPRNLAKTVTVE